MAVIVVDVGHRPITYFFARHRGQLTHWCCGGCRGRRSPSPGWICRPARGITPGHARLLCTVSGRPAGAPAHSPRTPRCRWFLHLRCRLRSRVRPRAGAGVLRTVTYGRFWSDRPYFGFHNTYRYEREHVSLDKYEIYDADRKRTFFNRVRYFTPEELTGELIDAGFANVDIFGDLTGSPYDSEAPWFAAAAKPASRSA